MRGLFDCDSLWCCWVALMNNIGHLLWLVRWPAAAYAVVYAVGAGIFLLTLRLQSTDGQLEVGRQSWAYMLAYPMRYGGHFTDTRTTTSICLVYAKLLNMLLFVWPVLLVYFAVTTVVGSVFVLLFGCVVYPDLHEGGFIKFMPVLGNSPRPVAIVTIPLALLIAAGWKLWVVLHFLKAAMWVAGCLLPVLAAIGVGTYIVLMLRSPKDSTVSVVAEYVGAQKEKFCKMVRIK